MSREVKEGRGETSTQLTALRMQEEAPEAARTSDAETHSQDAAAHLIKSRAVLCCG